jgi:hypothetical protein
LQNDIASVMILVKVLSCKQLQYILSSLWVKVLCFVYPAVKLFTGIRQMQRSPEDNHIIEVEVLLGYVGYS